MRQITSESCDAFHQRRKYKKQNTQVVLSAKVTSMYLHDNLIAVHDKNGYISITTAGWNTPTTRERLNGILGVQLYMDSGNLYLNGLPWDGELISLQSLKLFNYTPPGHTTILVHKESQNKLALDLCSNATLDKRTNTIHIKNMSYIKFTQHIKQLLHKVPKKLRNQYSTVYDYIYYDTAGTVMPDNYLGKLSLSLLPDGSTKLNIPATVSVFTSTTILLMSKIEKELQNSYPLALIAGNTPEIKNLIKNIILTPLGSTSFMFAVPSASIGYEDFMEDLMGSMVRTLETDKQYLRRIKTMKELSTNTT